MSQPSLDDIDARIITALIKDARASYAVIGKEVGLSAPAVKRQIAKDLGISDSCLRNWMHQADADENPGGERLSGGEKREFAELRRRNRLLEMENDILKRAAAYFARENVLPK